MCALPEHLQKNESRGEGTGTDLDNKAQGKWKRAWTAFSHKCPQGLAFLMQGIPWTKYAIPFFPVLRKWREFPVMLLGYNCPRWMGTGDVSVLFVPQFVRKWIGIWTPKEPWTATEMNKANPHFDRGHVTTLVPYGPSPIQDSVFGWSFQLTWPLHAVLSFRADARLDAPGVPTHNAKSRAFWRKMNGIFRKRYMNNPKKADEFVFFARGGFGRWDSGDDYFVAPDITIQFDYN